MWRMIRSDARTEVINVDPTWADMHQPSATGDRYMIYLSYLVYHANIPRFTLALCAVNCESIGAI